jgi:hypothetical protein
MSERKKQYSYDSKCQELAQHFLPIDVSFEMIRNLSQEIQDCVENFLSNAEYRATKNSNKKVPR